MLRVYGLIVHHKISVDADILHWTIRNATSTNLTRGGDMRGFATKMRLVLNVGLVCNQR